MCCEVKKLIEHYRVSEKNGEDDIRKGNALIRSSFAGVTPEELKEEEWAKLLAEAMWLEERKVKMYEAMFKIS